MLYVSPLPAFPLTCGCRGSLCKQDFGFSPPPIMFFTNAHSHPELWLLSLKVLWSGEGTNYLCKLCITQSLCLHLPTPNYAQLCCGWIVDHFKRWWKKPFRLNFRLQSLWWPSWKLPPLTRWSGELHALFGGCKETKQEWLPLVRDPPLGSLTYSFCHLTAMFCTWLLGG